MKSVLQEASSVTKAIEKAWHAAGEPEEFTVKVFETEKRNFFGFLKKAAVVSVLFDPRKTKEGAKEAREAKPARKPRREQRDRKEVAPRGQRQEHRDKPTAAPREERAPVEAPEAEKQPRPARETGWSPELIAEMTGELKELCKRLSIDEPSKITARGSTLRVDFAQPVIEEVEYERMLFSSFAHLLFQFIKREHRSKFRGLRIALSSGRRD